MQQQTCAAVDDRQPTCVNSALLHPAWLDALKSPATYPHPVWQIHLAETHIS